jgi:hypothetical protein
MPDLSLAAASVKAWKLWPNPSLHLATLLDRLDLPIYVSFLAPRSDGGVCIHSPYCSALHLTLATNTSTQIGTPADPAHAIVIRDPIWLPRNALISSDEIGRTKIIFYGENK